MLKKFVEYFNMNKLDEISKKYKITNDISNIVNFLFYVNIVLSILLLIFESQSRFITYVLIIVSILYSILLIVNDCLFLYNAEKYRRINCIEDGLDLDITNIKLDGYYNNKLPPSFNKYGLNTFENIYFSKSIAKKMLLCSTIKTVIACFFLILICIFFGGQYIVLIITQTVFSYNYILGFISLLFYINRLDKLYDDFYNIFITIGIENDKQHDILIVNIVEYESIKAHYKIQLSSKIYRKLQGELSDKWNEISKKCKTGMN